MKLPEEKLEIMMRDREAKRLPIKAYFSLCKLAPKECPAVL